jgi:hypothetical protein
LGDTSLAGRSFKDVWTVVQSSKVQNIPPVPDNSFGEIEVSSEKYARNIGLIYKNFQLYEHQPKSADYPQPYYTGLGITMWLVDNN